MSNMIDSVRRSLFTAAGERFLRSLLHVKQDEDEAKHVLRTNNMAGSSTEWNRWDSEQYIICPYDAAHRITAARFQRHLVKCRKVSLFQVKTKIH